MKKYEALKAVTQWIRESSSEDFMKNFNTLEGQYSGITIGEYLDHYGILDDEYEFQNIMTTSNFIFGLETVSINIQFEESIRITEFENIKVEVLSSTQYSGSYSPKNDSPYLIDNLSEAA